MRKILLLLVAVVASVSACYAHRQDHAVYSRLGLETTKPAALTVDGFLYYASNNTSAFWNVIAETDPDTGKAIDGTTAVVENTTMNVNGVDFPALKITSGTTINLRHKRRASYFEGSEVTERIPFDTRVGVKLYVLSDNNSNIKPKFTFRKTGQKYTTATGSYNTKTKYIPTVTFIFDAPVPTDGATLYSAVSGTYSDWSHKTINPTVGYVEGDKTFYHNEVYTDCNLILEGVQEGDVIAVVDVMLGNDASFANDDWTNDRWSNNWIIPTLNDEVTVDGLNQGEIYIQAEDFDEPWINGRTAHSNTQPEHGYADGYGYNPGRHRLYDKTCENIRIDLNYDSGESIGFNHWTEGHGHSKDGLSFGLTNFAAQQWDAVYNGETVSEGVATFEQLADYFGAWAEYTVNVEKELYADFSISHGIANANYNAYRSTGYQHGSLEIDGKPGVNYLKEYGGGYMLYVDGVPCRSNLALRPGNDASKIYDLSTWIDNTEAPAENSLMRAGNLNSYVTYAIPDPTISNGDSWPANYNTAKFENMKNAGLMDEATFNGLNVPDYANIYLTPGKHTIKVRSLGGRTTFDEIKVQAHANADTPTGIDRVSVLPDGNVDADAPVEYYNLQGMRVENPAGGIFIRRQGSRATKVVIR